MRPGCAEAQADSLAWLGLDWDGEPVAQSQRGELYDAALATLRERGVLYECFCSRADVRRAASAPHGPDGPLYSGACRDLSPGEREARRALGRPPALRVRMQGAVAFRDELMGPQREQLEETTGDIVLRRSDGVVAYQLAVVVDDAAQGVTHVVRGADLLASTARQIRLYELLGLGPAPGLRARPAAARRRRRASRQAPRCGRPDRAARRRAPTRARSSAGSRTAPD